MHVPGPLDDPIGFHLLHGRSSPPPTLVSHYDKLCSCEDDDDWDEDDEIGEDY